jgi:hypothetical protein
LVFLDDAARQEVRGLLLVVRGSRHRAREKQARAERQGDAEAADRGITR